MDFSAPASDSYPDLFTVQIVVTFRPGERAPKPLQYDLRLTVGSRLITAMPIATRRSGMFVVFGSSVRCPSGWLRLEAVSVLEAPKETGSMGDVDYHVPVGLLAFD